MLTPETPNPVCSSKAVYDISQTFEFRGFRCFLKLVGICCHELILKRDSHRLEQPLSLETGFWKNASVHSPICYDIQLELLR